MLYRIGARLVSFLSHIKLKVCGKVGFTLSPHTVSHYNSGVSKCQTVFRSGIEILSFDVRMNCPMGEIMYIFNKFSFSLFCSLTGVGFRKQLPEDPARKRRGGEHIPEEGHRKVLDNRPDPDRRKL